MLEISTNEYGLNNQRLVAKIQNGSKETYRKKTKSLSPCAIRYSSQSQKAENRITQTMTGETYFRRQPTETYATSFWRQWYLLTMRMIRCFCRDRSLGVIRLTVHFFVALVVGAIYVNIGNDAGQTLNNYSFIFAMLMFFMHTAFCSMTILCKFPELQIWMWHFFTWMFEFYCSPHWDANCGERAFQSLVFGKSVLFRIDIHRFPSAIRLCIYLCSDNVCDDWSTARIVSIHLYSNHGYSARTGISKHRHDCWCRVRGQGNMKLSFE